MAVLEKLKEFLFGRKIEEPCPVCGGTMVEQKSFEPDPYWGVNLRCGNCGAVSDGRTIHTGVPKERWERK